MNQEKMNRSVNTAIESCDKAVKSVSNIEKLSQSDMFKDKELQDLKHDILFIKHTLEEIKNAKNIKFVTNCDGCMHYFQTKAGSYCNLTGMQKSPKDWCGTLSDRGAETICWKCKNAVDGCSWSRKFIPVDGWDAIPKLIGNEQSYIVKSCPQFEKDIFNLKAETKEDFEQNEEFWVEE